MSSKIRLAAIGHCTEIDPERRGGRAVLKGTNFTVSQTLAELAETAGPDEMAGNFGLDADLIRQLLNGLALLFERPIADWQQLGPMPINPDIEDRLSRLKFDD